MQRKQQQKELPPSSQNIMATILQSIPKEASVTKIEYEGPRSEEHTSNSSHTVISYAVFCLKKKKTTTQNKKKKKTKNNKTKHHVTTYHKHSNQHSPHC